jgi:hypothetical protein
MKLGVYIAGTKQFKMSDVANHKNDSTHLQRVAGTVVVASDQVRS